jgi:hypothetical protein
MGSAILTIICVAALLIPALACAWVLSVIGRIESAREESEQISFISTKERFNVGIVKEVERANSDRGFDCGDTGSNRTKQCSYWNRSA